MSSCSKRNDFFKKYYNSIYPKEYANVIVNNGNGKYSRVQSEKPQMLYVSEVDLAIKDVIIDDLMEEAQ